MDIKVKNKVAELQRALEQDEQRISLSDPVAKMMLVAMAHQSCEIERKMEQTVARLSEQFCDQVLQRSNLQAQPAVSVVNIGNGREYIPYYIDENDIFTYKATKCNYRPIFKSRIIPGRIVACFMSNMLLQPNNSPLQATWQDNGHKDEVKMNSLCVMINKNGYDIDLLREAVRLGDFSAILQQKKEIISESEGIKREKSILNDET